MTKRRPSGLPWPRRIPNGVGLLLALALALMAPMAPAAADQGAHAGRAMSAPMHAAPTAEPGLDIAPDDGPDGGPDGGWLAHLACAVVCAGAPDPSAGVAPLGAPRVARALRLWPSHATLSGLALAPLRRPPKLPIA